MKKEEFYVPSKNGENQIHCIRWSPDGEVKGVVQLVHGMVEYIDRYHDFACYLTEQGFGVIGHDHLGHGRTASCDEELGYFAPKNGYRYILEDMYQVMQIGKKSWPGVPYFILGHSMGSFFTRRFLTLHGEELSGAIIMGTGAFSQGLAQTGKNLAQFLCDWQGPTKRSSLVYQLVLGGNNKPFKEEDPNYGWLTKDELIREKYGRDKFCTFRFTNSAYVDLFSILLELAKHTDMDRIPKDLPVFFVSGKEDPVGGKGKGVTKVYREFRDLGLKEVSMKLYEDDRHEILNELDRPVVYRDLAGWMEHHLSPAE